MSAGDSRSGPPPTGASAARFTSPALAAAAARLRCPHCGAALQPAERALVCARGHSHDVARQGYVTLLPPRRRLPLADSADMVAARDAFLAAGHFAPIIAAIVDDAREAAGSRGEAAGWAVDLGAGTGHHLAALLESLPAWSGVALDASRPALRHAVRAHPAIAGVACDAWQPLPLIDAAADLVLNVFAPRNGSEIARVLSPRGSLIVVTPAGDHLAPLSGSSGMLSVEADKQAQLRRRLMPHLQAVGRRAVSYEMRLEPDELRALVAMGPSAHHVSPDDVVRRLNAGDEPVPVIASVFVETFRRT